jgi:hypothetical protein
MFWKPDPDLYAPHLRRRIRAGKGVGEGIRYKRWLNIRDVPSSGTSSSTFGIRVPRPVHLLSEFETMYFYLLERQSSVIDIREQWPILTLDETLRLCSDFGVRHSMRNGCPEPFTIDFMVTEVIDGTVTYRAASIKTPEDARDPRVRQRLAIENEWCNARGIPWFLVDTSSFNRTLLDTLRFMRSWFRNRHNPDDALAEKFASYFLNIHSYSVPLGDLLAQVSGRLKLEPDQARDLLSYCTWSNKIRLCLTRPVAMNKPIVLDTEE